MKHILSIALCIICLACPGARGQWTPRIGHPADVLSIKDTVSITVIGDVMMHAKQLQYDHSHFLKHIAHVLKDSDIAVANMEFALGGEPYSGYPAFSAPDSYAEYMADCGTDVFLTANNHILDKGRNGLQRTLEVYGKMSNRVTATGSGYSEEELGPLVILKKGIRIAFVNFTYGVNSGRPAHFPRPMYMDRKEVGAAIERAKAKGADVIIALPHWGNEYTLRHNKKQEEWAEWLISQGVDAIIGSHPHVVQDSTHIGGKAVIYSLGNAVSNMSATNTRIELAVRLKLTVCRWSGEIELLEPELLPMWCSLPGMLSDNYNTIFIKEWATRRSEWLNPSDFDNMMTSLRRVSEATGTGIYSPAAILE